MLHAAIGIYGLLSYWVIVRESEIAIRLALGARPLTILRWTGLHALRLTAIGVAAGLLGGWAAAGTLGKLVYGVPARNPATMFAAAVAVTLLAVAAAAIPAWRAVRVDAARRFHHAWRLSHQLPRRVASREWRRFLRHFTRCQEAD